MKRLIALLTLLLTPALAADISGTWKGTAEGPNGSMERTFTFKQDGEKIDKKLAHAQILDPIPIWVVFPLLIRLAKPRWFVHGHVHLYDIQDRRMATEGPTTVLNAFGHWLIDTEEAAT